MQEMALEKMKDPNPKLWSPTDDAVDNFRFPLKHPTTG